MSRSYKKAVFKMAAVPQSKATANQTVRNAKDIANGSSYKKLFESWEICDMCCDIQFDKIPCTWNKNLQKKFFKLKDAPHQTWKMWK